MEKKHGRERAIPGKRDKGKRIPLEKKHDQKTIKESGERDITHTILKGPKKRGEKSSKSLSKNRGTRENPPRGEVVVDKKYDRDSIREIKHLRRRVLKTGCSYKKKSFFEEGKNPGKKRGTLAK